MTDSLEDREETGMPQPLSRVRKINVMQWGAGCLKKHPDFAAIVAEVIAGWSTAEAEQAQLLANLLDTDLKTGMAMYFSHQSPEPRRKLLAAEAYACFAPGSVERDLFDLIERAIKPIRNQRNAFAHGLWAFSEDIPEALMLVDVDDYVQHRIDNFEKIHESGHADVDFFGADITMVYRKPDFDRALIES